MKKYFSLFTASFIVCLIATSLPSHAMDDQEKEKYILVAGTSSSGKSTTTQELGSKCPKFLINGRDEIEDQVEKYRDYDPKNSEKETPDEYDLNKDKYYLGHLAQWVVKHQDKPLILDVLAPQPILEALEKLNFYSPPFKVLLYVPLSKYRERLRTRNRKAFEEMNREELRTPLDMVLQYEAIFKVSEQDTNLPLGMKINEEGMREILNDFSQDAVAFEKEASKKGFSNPIENEKEFEEELEEEHQSDIQKTLNKMFSSLKEGYLVPKDNYDLIIDTSVSSSSEIADLIQKTFLEKK